jgi:RAT1-interacting protein
MTEPSSNVSTQVSVPLIKTSDDIDPSCCLPAVLGPPRQSACLSVFNEKLEIDSTISLRYFVQPPLDISMNSGRKEFLQQDWNYSSFGKPRRLDSICQLCTQSRSRGELLQAEVVTWRGILTKLVLILEV